MGQVWGQVRGASMSSPGMSPAQHVTCLAPPGSAALRLSKPHTEGTSMEMSLRG